MVVPLWEVILLTIFEGVDDGTSVALVVAVQLVHYLQPIYYQQHSSINCKIIRCARSKTINSNFVVHEVSIKLHL
jgi:hypothetical protein